MKLCFSQQAYNKLDRDSQARLTAISCDCVAEGKEADPECFLCDGAGQLYEQALSPEESADIQENLRRQGVPLGKIGTH